MLYGRGNRSFNQCQPNLRTETAALLCDFGRAIKLVYKHFTAEELRQAVTFYSLIRRGDRWGLVLCKPRVRSRCHGDGPGPRRCSDISKKARVAIFITSIFCPQKCTLPPPMCCVLNKKNMILYVIVVWHVEDHHLDEVKWEHTLECAKARARLVLRRFLGVLSYCHRLGRRFGSLKSRRRDVSSAATRDSQRELLTRAGLLSQVCACATIMLC